MMLCAISDEPLQVDDHRTILLSSTQVHLVHVP